MRRALMTGRRKEIRVPSAVDRWLFVPGAGVFSALNCTVAAAPTVGTVATAYSVGLTASVGIGSLSTTTTVASDTIAADTEAGFLVSNTDGGLFTVWGSVVFTPTGGPKVIYRLLPLTA